MPESANKAGEAPQPPTRRLCSEIQLFDLCDLERCSSRDGRFCTDQDLMTRFERIADVDSTAHISSHDDEDDVEDDFGGEDDFDHDDGFDDGYDDYDDYDDREED